MYCRYCGTKNADNAQKCKKCGAGLAPPVMPPLDSSDPAAGAGSPQFQARAMNIPNHLSDAIITTLCCCMPFGIVAIIYAAQVNTKLAQGDIDGALYASRNAKIWSWIAFGAGALSAIASVLFELFARTR